MDLSQLKWFKNVKRNDGRWAYQVDDMPMPEEKIFRLHWHSNKGNASQPNKGDLIALVQQAKVTHIVEVLEDTVYDTKEAEWGIYRVVKAIWMPPKNFDWSQLPHHEEVLGSSHLPPNGYVHELSTPTISKSQLWKDCGGIEGLQEHISEILCHKNLKNRNSGLQGRMQSGVVGPDGLPTFKVVSPQPETKNN